MNFFKNTDNQEQKYGRPQQGIIVKAVPDITILWDRVIPQSSINPRAHYTDNAIQKFCQSKIKVNWELWTPGSIQR